MLQQLANSRLRYIPLWKPSTPRRPKARARSTVFWPDTRMTYVDGGDLDDLEQASVSSVEYDGRTPLDKTIDRIGMGSYQWALLSLCGFGWLADNMWIQAIAIILPRVQQHYAVPDSYIGALSSSMFAGMMLGAVGWGTCSDIIGRSAAFNMTLFFTSVFGMLASMSQSFWMLCTLLFLLGSSVGGSMPTDGTLLLEHMPKNKQYLVTALSVFFSFGSVVSALVGLIVIPRHSCSPNQPCDPATDNKGWQYMLVSLGLITFSMFLARIVFFRLHESPRYLVNAGRPQEALENLQLISRFNGSELSLELEDVDDRQPPKPLMNGLTGSEERIPFLTPSNVADAPPRPTIITTANTCTAGDVLSVANDVRLDVPREEGAVGYRSTDESPNSLDCHSFITPVDEAPLTGTNNPATERVSVHDDSYGGSEPKHRQASAPRRCPPARLSGLQPSSTIVVEQIGNAFSRTIRRPFLAWKNRIKLVLSPEWFRTTMLVWGAWFFISLAYTIFNVYFPKLLEGQPAEDALPRSLQDTLWDVVIFTLGGCPGALLGAFMVEGTLGRRGSLAGMTVLTALSCLLFVQVKSPFMIRLSSLGVSLCSTTMYAVLYGWTPEIFGTKVRGSACGIASALSRIGGMIAPMLGGALLMVSRALPVYTSIVVYIFAAACVLFLHEKAGDSFAGFSSH